MSSADVRKFRAQQAAKFYKMMEEGQIILSEEAEKLFATPRSCKKCLGKGFTGYTVAVTGERNGKLLCPCVKKPLREVLPQALATAFRLNGFEPPLPEDEHAKPPTLVECSGSIARQVLNIGRSLLPPFRSGEVEDETTS